MDETYIKVAGQWKYLYRAVDKWGDTVDFLLTAKRDLAAAGRYLKRAINLHGLPDKITIDKSGANTAAIRSVNDDACVDIELRPPMATSISPTFGRSNSPMEGRTDYDESPVMVMRAAASLSL
jgi:transposase-like protein